MCKKESLAVVYLEMVPVYHGDKLAQDVWVLQRKIQESSDGYSNIVLIAFAMVEVETDDVWTFVLSNLTRYVMTWNGVGLISNRHESINSIIARSNRAWDLPRAIHMHCIRHITSNFLRKFKTLYLQKLMVNIRQSMNLICDTNDYVIGTRFRATFYRLNELFTKKKVKVEACISTGYNAVFEVCKMPSDQIAYHHVFACYANQFLDWQVYVHEVYRMRELRKVYRAKFRPLKNTITWLVVGGPRMIHNLILRKVCEGCPRKRICFLNEMDMRKMCGLRHCRLCGVEGYSRSRCPHRSGSSIGGNAQK
ncbi:hypothetical protein Ahy_B06g084043 [Arachis hypogaea]|uniref:CCHC-type domain-containing protein n=1 Tax=Arachis hypogaea TaxID=3818 RepID=A0A444YR38_ARAHY|nr:hypothetical protein Ahy_B06g084043 [Arachis hypogaea]